MHDLADEEGELYIYTRLPSKVGDGVSTAAGRERGDGDGDGGAAGDGDGDDDGGANWRVVALGTLNESLSISLCKYTINNK